MRKGQRGRAKKAWAGIKQNQIPHACKTRKDGAPQRQDQFTRTQSRLGIYRVGQRAQPQFGQVGASTNGCATRADEGCNCGWAHPPLQSAQRAFLVSVNGASVKPGLCQTFKLRLYLP